MKTLLIFALLISCNAHAVRRIEQIPLVRCDSGGDIAVTLSFKHVLNQFTVSLNPNEGREDTDPETQYLVEVGYMPSDGFFPAKT